MQNQRMFYGYSRVSADGSDFTIQPAQLTLTGYEKVLREKITATTDRPQLELTPYQQREAQARVAAGETQHSIAGRCNIIRATISRIKT